MADEQPLEEFVEQRISNDHSGIFSVSPSNGEFFEHEAFLDYYDDLVEFDPLSFNGLCDAINWDILGFSDPDPNAILFGSGSPAKRDHDLILKLWELLEACNTSKEADRCFALAVQLGMAYQRLLLRPAEEMAKSEAKTRKQRRGLSKNRQKISQDKACELCEQIQEENEQLDTRAVAKKASAQYKNECGTDVSPETIRKLWSKHKAAWRERRDRDMRIHERRLDLFAKIKATGIQSSNSSSRPRG